ncbi:hypothetical protein [Halobacillus faecis]|uniref:Uncharacterized protein n=1 Tax=Halobacillus faecis TaxID=360184 RepID=A0A511WNN7_9BACI|nr:hypothetical protein [Halobacillus faecis]GEN52760.1 hypothetical protein HFA01_10220 [Halobacillus faecis]
MLKYFLYGGFILATIHAVQGSAENMILLLFVSMAVIALLEVVIRNSPNKLY